MIGNANCGTAMVLCDWHALLSYNVHKMLLLYFRWITPRHMLMASITLLRSGMMNGSSQEHPAAFSSFDVGLTITGVPYGLHIMTVWRTGCSLAKANRHGIIRKDPWIRGQSPLWMSVQLQILTASVFDSAHDNHDYTLISVIWQCCILERTFSLGTVRDQHSDAKLIRSI